VAGRAEATLRSFAEAWDMYSGKNGKGQ
jgi:hypothetical protein